MNRICKTFPLIAIAIALLSCSGKSSIQSAPMPNVSGSWEFIAASTQNPGYSTGIEVALKEGQVLSGGIYVEDGQISAAGSQINFVGFTPSGNIAFGGNCAPAADNTGNSLSGSISGYAGSMNFTFTENGNVFNVSALLDASGQLIDGGTYSAQSGSGCNDSGNITGQIAPKLSGTYAGPICQPLDQSCQTQTAAQALLGQSGSNLTVNVTLTSTNTLFTLTGPVTGNAFTAQGTFQGQTVSYNGYYEVINEVPSVYLVNLACNSSNPQTCINVLPVFPPPQ